MFRFLVSLPSLFFGNHVVQCLRGHLLAGLVAFHLWVFPGAFTRRSPWQLRTVDAFWVESLEFLGAQGVTALANLALSHRDSLLLDARSMVPAEEVTRLRYAALTSSSGILPSLLLDSALTKMRAVSNDALVQRTLHPPKIPRKSLAGPSKAGSSLASSADRGSVSPVVSRSQQQASTTPSSSSSQRGRKRRGNKGKAPFSGASGGSGFRGQTKRDLEKVLLTGFCLCCGWGVVCRCIGGTGSQLERVPGCSPSCGTVIASPSWTLLLPSLAP